MNDDNMKIQLKIKPKGRSMLPFLKEARNSVVVEAPKRPIKKYDIVLYKYNDVYVLHRVMKTGETAYIICGDNSYVLEKVEKENIIGVVTEIISGNRKYSADNVFLKLCVKAWYGLKKAVRILKSGLKALCNIF